MFLLLVAPALLLAAYAAAATTSPKRGLLYISSSTSTDDSELFTSAPTDITWYYNYAVSPSSPIKKSDLPTLEFVPMLWDTTSADNFAENVMNLIAQGVNVTSVLGFNEPDQKSDVGGSNIAPELAAAVWKRAIEPLAAQGIRLGAPAVSGGPDGMTWLKKFVSNCTDCHFSFIPLHWYGSFQALTWHIADVNNSFPNVPMWLTEFAFDNQPLGVTEDFFNETLTYLDALDAMERYSWFGAFRSDTSNVGPNVAFLDSQGRLTDLGAEYLGKNKTFIAPNTSAARKSGGGGGGGSAWQLAIVVAVAIASTVAAGPAVW